MIRDITAAARAHAQVYDCEPPDPIEEGDDAVWRVLLAESDDAAERALDALVETEGWGRADDDDGARLRAAYQGGRTAAASDAASLRRAFMAGHATKEKDAEAAFMAWFEESAATSPAPPHPPT